jgi:hypothetical protein
MPKHKCAVLVLVSAATICLSRSAVEAGGLIQNLPADGSWVVFRAKSDIDLQGNLQSFERELKVASVGKATVEDEPARWIELSTEIGGRRVLAKLLIAEKYLRADENPFDHIVKAWSRGPEGEVRELAENRLRQLLLFAATVPNFDKPEKKQKERIKTELGEFECDRLKGQTELEALQGNKIKVEGDLWIHEKIPFGLVKAEIKGDLGVGTIETHLEAVRSGTDATTELPDAK